MIVTSGVSLIATLLLTTALLKTLYPADATAVALAYGLNYSAIAFVVQLELLVAALLLSGWRPQLVVRMAAVLFALFAAFSFSIALAGNDTCGCFGSLPVNPWFTFTLDVVVVGVLLWMPMGRAGLPFVSRRVLLTFAGYLLVAVWSLVFMLTHRPTLASTHATIDTSTGLVILEPKEWVGEVFPLTSFIVPEVDFSAEETWVLVYHHDCPACQRKLDEYASRSDGARVVLVEVPPYGPARHDGGAAISARLAGDVEWFIQTPTEIRLQGGVVREVRQE